METGEDGREARGLPFPAGVPQAEQLSMFRMHHRHAFPPVLPSGCSVATPRRDTSERCRM